MNRKFKNAFACSIVVFLGGCGTLNTAIRDESVARENLNQVETPCKTIPRVYSGVFYDICILRGKPPHTVPWIKIGSVPTPLIIADMMLSSVLDTIILPYTTYSQISDGDIELK